MKRQTLSPWLLVVTTSSLVLVGLSFWKGQAAAEPQTKTNSPATTNRHAIASTQVAAEPIAADLDRSPIDLVLGPKAEWLATANQSSDTVSLVRLTKNADDAASSATSAAKHAAGRVTGKVVDELRVGHRPGAITRTPDGQRLLVTGSYSGDLTILSVQGDKLQVEHRLQLGFEPYGIAVTRDGRKAYVALSMADQVAEIDLQTNREVARIDVGLRPRYLTLTPDDSRLAVGTSGDRGITVVDTATRQELFKEQFLALNIGHLQTTADGRHVYFPWVQYRHSQINPAMIRLGWVLGTRLARVRLDEPARREAMSLDPPGKAVGDPFGLAITPNEQRIVTSASGTHELLVYRLNDLPLTDYANLDHINPQLVRDEERFVRIPLGGRPMGIRAADDRTIYVANYLLNNIQVVDIDNHAVIGTISLGGPAEPSAARRGEAIFLDAGRSLDQWYSCHTCHYDGGSNDERMDTWNDGTPNTYKTVLSLHRIHETGPWTWHGWQTDLRDAMHSSLTTTMQGPKPSEEDVTALLAYLKTMELPPNPFRLPDGGLTEQAERGKKVFHSEKAGCAQCHSGPSYTDGEIHDVGLGAPVDRYQGYNTPSLVGVYRKTRLLHDGRARSLDQVLTEAHNPAKVTGKGELTDAERADLIAYLKSL
ncbi:MAG: c-type cytochrome [Planctomycetota bacterium]